MIDIKHTNHLRWAIGTCEDKKMSIDKIMIVNDDTADIVSIKDRLSSKIKVIGASQYEGKFVENNDLDLIIIDNDANDRNEAKGVETLTKIKENMPDTPIIYTSFQPGWVDQEVYKTKGVMVVKTDEIFDYLKKQFDMNIQQAKTTEKVSPEVSIILTYNSVMGFEPGIYGNGKLVIASNVEYARGKAKEVLNQKMDELYKGFDFRKDRDIIKNIFVYDGINGGDTPGESATSLGHDARMVVNLIACRCEWERKKNVEKNMRVKLYKSECSGYRTLGTIADIIMGIERPNENIISIPKYEIINPAKKFGM